MAKAPFVSLHNHTELGSPLDGMNDVFQLFNQAKELDHRAIAITDHGTLTAHYDAYQASVKSGVKLIPGIEAYFAPDLEVKKSYHLVLLPKNHNGYKNILRLNYEAFRNQVSGYMGKKTPRITWEHLESFNQDVFCLTACSNGPIAKALITNNDEDEAIKRMLRLKSIFGERLFLELQPHLLKTDDGKVDQVRLNSSLVQFSKDYDINYTITCDAHYLDKDHAKYHDLMLAIKDKKAVDDPDRFRYGVQDMYLKSHEEIVDFFGSDIALKGMSNSVKIAEECEDPSYLKATGAKLPSFPVEKESDYKKFIVWQDKADSDVEEDKAYLRYKCILGFKEKFSHLDPKMKKIYWDRIKMELSVLEDKNFSSYMLIVADYINWAKQRMPVGPARGSAAGSMVAYITGITDIDPIKYDLIFERFHNNQKTSFPDIDTDFSNPALVKEYIKEKYGQEKVASISNWSTLSPKVAIKDVARSLRLGGDKSAAFKISNHITSIMPDAKTIEKAMEDSNQFSDFMRKYPDLYQFANKLQNLTRNWSVHAAGLVIGQEALYDFVPLRIDDEGSAVTQWEKTRCEDNGLIKMDLLGLKTLTVIDNTFKIIKETSGKEISIKDMDLSDKEVYDMLGRGETSGVFQLESSLTPFCIKLKPNSIEDISAINAIGRPSCLPEERKKYARRRLGLEDTKYDHPKLKRALESTYGILVYEEQAMFIAQDCAGWDLNQADSLRKISKLKGKDPDLVLKTEANFVKDCMENTGMDYKTACLIWKRYIEPLGGYAFNKSHSISYSHISFYTAWLRCHYPTEFMCALLNSEDPNSDKSQEYISECDNLNITITPPDINLSSYNYSVTGDRKITSGFSCVKGLGTKAVNEIVSKQPFECIQEFLGKCEGRVVNKTAVQSLAKAGAFDSTGRTRLDIHDNYAKYRTKINNGVKKGKEYCEIELPEYNDEWERKEILVFERTVLGRTISGKLHEAFKGFFSNSSIVTKLNKVETLDKSKTIRVEAIIKTLIKEFKIKNGKNIGRKFGKYLIEDVDGNTCGLTLWTDDYEKYKALLVDGVPFKAICSVNEYLGQKDLSLKNMERIYGSQI